MPSPELPLEVLMMIAHHIRDDDFNSFLRVNRARYACLNRMLWKEAEACAVRTQLVLTHSIKTNNLADLEFFPGARRRH
jgi:hypothetical protein